MNSDERRWMALDLPAAVNFIICSMKNSSTIDDPETLGKRHQDATEITTLDALLKKARSLGFSESEVATLRHKYGQEIIGNCK